MEEDGSWHNWIEISDENESILYSDLTLKVGQPVKCKIVALSHIKSAISLEIYEPGVTKAFDVVEGEIEDKMVRFGVNETGWITWLDPETQVEYTWVLRTNDNWIKGRAPLNGFCEVTDTSTATENLIVDLSFAYPYIENEQWTGPSYTPGDGNNGDTNPNGDNNNTGTPGFELIGLVLAVCISIILNKSRRM